MVDIGGTDDDSTWIEMLKFYREAILRPIEDIGFLPEEVWLVVLIYQVMRFTHIFSVDSTI
jgi:hypothetical protein